jgi:O-antigen/teichoic acid export membrane protein
VKQDFKILVKHFITYGASIYLSKLIGFFMIPVYTTYLTPADYGVLELLDLIMYVVNMIVGLGLINSIIRFYSDCKTDGEKSEVISTAFFYVLLAAICVNGVLVAFSGPISRLIFSSHEATAGPEQLSFFVKIVACSGILDILAGVGISYLQSEKKSIIFTIVSVTRFLIAVTLNIVFVVGLKLGVVGVLYSQIIAAAFACAVMTWLMHEHLGRHISTARAMDMVRYGAPLIVSSLSMFIIHFADRFFLERITGLAVLGIYSLSYKLAMVLPALLYGPFEMIWNAQMFDLYKKGEDGHKTINYINKYMLVGSLWVIVAYALCVKDLVYIMAAPKFHEAYRAVPPLLLAFLFTGLTATSTVGILFAKKTVYRGLANVYGAIVALVGYYFLIHAYGYWGAVITTFLALLVRYVAGAYYSQRFYRIDYSLSLHLKTALAAGVAYGAGSMISIDNHFVSLFIRGMAGFALFGILAVGLKIFNRYELAAIGSLIKTVRFRGKVDESIEQL